MVAQDDVARRVEHLGAHPDAPGASAALLAVVVAEQEVDAGTACTSVPQLGRQDRRAIEEERQRGLRPHHEPRALGGGAPGQRPDAGRRCPRHAAASHFSSWRMDACTRPTRAARPRAGTWPSRHSPCIQTTASRTAVASRTARGAAAPALPRRRKARTRSRPPPPRTRRRRRAAQRAICRTGRFACWRVAEQAPGEVEQGVGAQDLRAHPGDAAPGARPPVRRCRAQRHTIQPNADGKRARARHSKHHHRHAQGQGQPAELNHDDRRPVDDAQGRDWRPSRSRGGSACGDSALRPARPGAA